MKNSKGFTLIELLISITIIGILAALIIISVAGAKNRARDVKRKSDLDAIKVALELAAEDPAGTSKYPVVAEGNWCQDNQACWNNDLLPKLKKFIADLGQDPQAMAENASAPFDGGYHYAYQSKDGQTYNLVALLSSARDADSCKIRHYRYFSTVIKNKFWCDPDRIDLGTSQFADRLLIRGNEL